MTPRDADTLVMARPERGAIALDRRALPAIGPDDALIRVRRAGICGTDLHIVSWNAWAAGSYVPPVALGHEFCGEVVERGRDVTRLEPGDLVCAETHIACGTCSQCRRNRRHTCLDLRVFSKLGRGCFAEYTVVPQQALRRVPPAIPLDRAAVMEPFGIALRAVMEADLRVESFFVVGCGPTGLFAVAAARALGAGRIIAADPLPFRRDLALAVGADAAIDPQAGAYDRQVAALTQGEGVAVALDTSGHPPAIRDALACLSPGGTMFLIGLPSKDVAFDLARQVVLRETSLRGLYGRRIDETWMAAEKLLASPSLRIEPILTHHFPLAAFDEAFATAQSGQAGKVLFRFD